MGLSPDRAKESFSLKYEGNVYRPPSEAYSLIIQATIGCSHNSCTFCPMYLGEKFRVRPFEDVFRDLQEARTENPHVERIFYADGDAMCLSTEKFLALLGAAYSIFPECERVSVYGRADNIRMKSDAELKQLKDAGLGMIYLGAESGSDEVLKRVNKGETRAELIEAVRRAEAAGIPVSVTFISGLGGKELMREHAVETGTMIGEMGASYVGLLTLLTAPGTPLFRDVMHGKFKQLSTAEVLKELELILENAECVKPCVIRSNHASNRLVIKGTLPDDRERLLAQVRAAMNDSRLLRPKQYRGF
jgi:radical SAM superfamily enzyme YgiQ (UPF0313 family)